MVSNDATEWISKLLFRKSRAENQRAHDWPGGYKADLAEETARYNAN